jgi:nitroimidazol reductase NimA-like FMN-containing flavoprotein (pyridoxamine 5'-phosphate oxidase superfamily)
MADIDEPILGTQSTEGGAIPSAGPPIQEKIRRLVTDEPYSVLCTQGHDQPYGSVVAFSFEPSLRYAVFSTAITTRKYRLLTACDRVALVVDSRSRHPGDLMRVEAVTVTGRAAEVRDMPERKDMAQLLLSRHPYLKGFVEAPSCALFRVDVFRFLHVMRFQEVHEWIPPEPG